MIKTLDTRETKRGLYQLIDVRHRESDEEYLEDGIGVLLWVDGSKRADVVSLCEEEIFESLLEGCCRVIHEDDNNKIAAEMITATEGK